MNKFKITYFLENTILSQFKNLIYQEEYEVLIKPLINEIYNLEILLNTYNKKNKKYSEIELKIKELKSSLSKYGEYFTDESPLGKALLKNKGFLHLPNDQGGTYFIKFEKIG